jgi:hypothetical protein
MVIKTNTNPTNQFRLPEKLLDSESSERTMRDFLAFFINASVPNSIETAEAKGRVFPIYKPLQKSLLGFKSANIFKNLGGISFSGESDDKFLVKPSLSEREYIEEALLPIVNEYVNLHNTIEGNTDNIKS